MTTADVAPTPKPVRVDAYLDWMRRMHPLPKPAENPDAQPLLWVFLLLELREPAAAFAKQAATFCPELVRVPEHYAQPPDGLQDSAYCTAVVHPLFLSLLAAEAAKDKAVNQAQASADQLAHAHALILQIERFELGCHIAPWAAAAPARLEKDPLKANKPKPSSLSTAPLTVVVGVIDDGLAFANERFCHTHQGARLSRFLALWDQDTSARPASATTPWHHGQSHSADELNGYLQHAEDEDHAYAAAAYTAVKSRAAHGTHVLDLACGAALHQATALNAPAIVGVQLPLNSILDTSCASAAPFILDGLRYVLHHADAAAASRSQRCASVINLSFGDLAGPHDGSSLLERAFDDVIARRRAAHHPCHIVMAAGNSYLSRCHARICLAPGEKVTLPWHIQPDDATANFLELWPRLEVSGKAENAAKLDLQNLNATLTPPRGAAISLRGHAAESRVSSHQYPAAMIALHPQPANGDGPMGLFVIAPTALPLDVHEPSHPMAPCGDWMLTLHNQSQQTWVCHAYIQRDDISYGRKYLGRQSFFKDPADEPFNERGDWQLQDKSSALVQRCGTLNSLACGSWVDIAGSVDAKGTPAPYSSVKDGDARPTDAHALHLLATTDDSRVTPGLLAAGTRSTSVVALHGTSMAAPQLTRALAQAYLSGKSLELTAYAKATDHDGLPRSVLPLTGLTHERFERRHGIP
jgi:Subtilase family